MYLQELCSYYPPIHGNRKISLDSQVSCALASGIGVWILNRFETFREEGALKDVNFKEFIEEYLEKNANFIPAKKILKDRKLHDIYVRWEISMKKINI